jgi:hypothetical protein
MDLSRYRSIGIIEFSSAGTAGLGPYATQEFIHQIQHAQPGLRFVELGNKAQVLAVIGRRELDLEAIKLIGSKFNVDLLAAGSVEVSDIKADFKLSKAFTSINAKATTNLSLSAKFWETATAATAWTDSVGMECPVAELGLDSRGKASVGINDPQEKYGHIVSEMIHCLMPDFQPRYIKKRIS